MKNKLNALLKKVDAMPFPYKNSIKSFLIGRTVPFVGTVGVYFEKTNEQEWIVTLKNKRKVGNHLNQVHAAAMVLLAETAAVFLTAANLPDHKLPLVKKIDANFVKRSYGSLRAVAKLTEAQRHEMQLHDKGEMLIEVIVTDENDLQPVIVHVTSAWILKPVKT